MHCVASGIKMCRQHRSPEVVIHLQPCGEINLLIHYGIIKNLKNI